jgi:hypothetical protein
MLIVAGLVLLAAGVIVTVAGRFQIPLGRLPGDIRIERESVRVYIPIMSMLIASVVLSLVLYIVRRMF